MREIKFRGKRLDKGAWMYGSLVILNGRHFIFDNADRHEVDPETVGQYTERKDNNGTEIYEGDIVKWDECVADYKFITQIAEVSYNKSLASFEPLGEYCYDFFEAIGNIHDNPELMEGGEQ